MAEDGRRRSRPGPRPGLNRSYNTEKSSVDETIDLLHEIDDDFMKEHGRSAVGPEVRKLWEQPTEPHRLVVTFSISEVTLQIIDRICRQSGKARGRVLDELMYMVGKRHDEDLERAKEEPLIENKRRSHGR